ncbi:unnamed protein product [Angiostrongylus costaricensis]|uniref:Uncharacterized protein n=1 Tax=Angiostrongylus costaricensis TaxID=334426 RepID=A0A0R3PW45_ANGCS|nr:unnamed protein product [Angiostrongylus costaricensis]
MLSRYVREIIEQPFLTTTMFIGAYMKRCRRPFINTPQANSHDDIVKSDDESNKRTESKREHNPLHRSSALKRRITAASSASSPRPSVDVFRRSKYPIRLFFDIKNNASGEFNSLQDDNADEFKCALGKIVKKEL